MKDSSIVEFPEKNESNESLKVFRLEMAELKNNELNMKDSRTANFSALGGIEPLELNDSDMLMWEKVNDSGGIVSRTEFDAYRDEANESEITSRKNFAAFLGNKLAVLWMREEMKQVRKAS